MFGLSVKLFRVFGIDVKVDFSWALFAIFIAWALAQGVFPQLYEGFSAAAYWWMALAAIIGLAASIIIHELSHSLVAKALGLPLKSITLFIFGGVAELEEEPKNPFTEFVMAIAGPAASVVLALLFGWIARGAASVSFFASLSNVFEYLLLINWVLAAFNMLPAFPLDGGRVFRSIVWAVKRDLTAATRIAARMGVMLGTSLIVLGVIWAILGQFAGGLWWVLIGLFIRSAASGAVYQEQMLRLFKGAPVRDFMTPDPICVAPDSTLREFVDSYVYEYHFDLFPVTRGAELLGAMGLNEAKTVAREKWDRVKVGDVMTPISDNNTIEVQADAMDALLKMHKGKVSRLMVVDSGRLVGMLALKDLLDLLSLKMALEGR
jgi:Zn-dependent protease/CBS domain-containing protein